MTRAMRRGCASRGAPLGLVLEGGYALGALARSVVATMRELTRAAPDGPAADVEPTREAREARERLAGRWPTLKG
jgi:acetoin utilization deacetylase AcuC-like enzyme